ncbi:MAG: hypothetical protein HN736_18595 [Anaerolineae bacterium]|jgi:murein DD-endopeptidase MepM/ murein hydrolase activator NlpD|nr:hypothetical protein [Anaerolineae bacterium]MBT4310002.1 hypothetical protein [Anaerolineae bacterium]MBT4458020.1 hypothetical protein [Anaerolineae bacterium]MBT6060871.1 hypothetical protein [Anaerolineae bacterium]MBT6322210.1 hypothetical protein [Anaerolineae bacterium]
MKKITLLFSLLSILLASCGAKPALWGEYSTPTPKGFAPPIQAAQVAITTPTATSNIVIEASPTATIRPTKIPLQNTPMATQEVNTPSAFKGATILYYSQSGDTLDVVASHFGVDVENISSTEKLPAPYALLDPNTLLVVPDKLEETTSSEQIFPDSEVVFSATGMDFNTLAYVAEADGYFSEYKEYLGSTGWTTGAEGIARLAEENALNPRLLIALAEYESGWILGDSGNLSQKDYPLGYIDTRKRGMFRQMMVAVQDLAVGYYDWRSGKLTELTFPDGTTKRIAPDLNAGSVAMQYYFAQKLDPDRWVQAVDPRTGFPALYAELFGDPWTRAQSVEPLFPAGLKQPDLALPFEPRQEWAYTGGPHSAWAHEGAIAALDFAPANDFSGCAETEKWVTASASGLVVRSDRGVVMLDLDGDGNEETGWSLLHLHIATEGRIPLGTWVEKDDRLGQPSCEGGVSTGTHLHFARKYNGEWILADGPLPFNLDGWIAHNGEKIYEGTLTREDETIISSQVGEKRSVIFRDNPEGTEDE